MRVLKALILSCSILLLLPNCKGSKEVTTKKPDTSAVDVNQLAKAKDLLMSIINDDGELSVAEMEDRLNQVRNMGLQDPALDSLIQNAESKISERKASAERLRLEQLQMEKDESLKVERQATLKKLEKLFNDVVNNGSVAVEEGLEYFASEDVPVLIIVSKRGDQIDYDKPTTIRKYLEYLKDQKRNLNYIESAKFDKNNKVEEIVLTRTNVLLAMDAVDLPPTKEGELDPIRKMAVDELALEKVRDLGKYIHIIGSKETPFSETNRAIERALELFEPGSTMEVSSLNRKEINTYKIEDYFKRLSSLNYDQVSINWTEIKYISDLERQADGRYMGVITTYQYFEGKSGGEIRYKDRTKKDVTVYVEGKETQISGQLIDFWDVLLGNIKVSETVPFVKPLKTK